MTCLASCDVQNMTPLHCAAMFDHPEIVEYLIAEGADINPMDKEKRSPLLLAALRGGWRTVHTLIRLGANINIKDVNRRNVLHLVVMNGGRLEQFAAEVSKVIRKKHELVFFLVFCSEAIFNVAQQKVEESTYKGNKKFFINLPRTSTNSFKSKPIRIKN